MVLVVMHSPSGYNSYNRNLTVSMTYHIPLSIKVTIFYTPQTSRWCTSDIDYTSTTAILLKRKWCKIYEMLVTYQTNHYHHVFMQEHSHSHLRKQSKTFKSKNGIISLSLNVSSVLFSIECHYRLHCPKVYFSYTYLV